MRINRRDAVKALFAGVAASALPPVHTARAAAGTFGRPRSFTLGNGLRTHYVPNSSGYVAATLVLRSREIAHDGLAHICEHTSCVGAAGAMSAAEVAASYKVCVQEGNATTEPGALTWHASFLPQYLPQVAHLLAVTALDQKFDVETVAAQARVVLEELYLEKYTPDKLVQCKFDRALLGSSHPYAKDTMEEEIARCRLAPAKLAAQLRDFAAATRLPANMDLFLVGSVEPGDVERLVDEHFGKYAYASGPLLDIPPVAVTRAYKSFTESSQVLQRPLSELRLAWNTGVCLTNVHARVLLAMSEYLSASLFDELREKDGDTYTPEVAYEPDVCSGVLNIWISSSKAPERVEKRVFDVIDKMKADIDAKELTRLRDRTQLKRRKEAADNEKLLACLVDRTLHGASLHDLKVDTVTREELLAATRRYLPSHCQAYVRLALKGR